MSLKESLGNLGGLLGGQQALTTAQNSLANAVSWPNGYTTAPMTGYQNITVTNASNWSLYASQQIPFTWPAPNCSCGQPAVATCLACTKHDSAPTMANPAGIEFSHYLCFGCFILHYADGHANIRQDTPEPHPIEEAAEESAVNG